MGVVSRESRARGAVLAVFATGAVLTTSGCIDPGPMDQLRGTVAAFEVPNELLPAKMGPWLDYDWDSVDLDQGGAALVWEGPRGIDNQTAWLLANWQVPTDSVLADADEQACAVWVEFVSVNSTDAHDPEKLSKRCLRWPTNGNSVTSSWQTTTDGVPVDVSAVLTYVKRAGAYRLTAHLSE